MNAFGRHFRLSLFGESHGAGVGVVLDGVPPGLRLDVPALQHDLDRRRPGRSLLVTQRDEPDVPAILSGVAKGRTTGAPVCIFIANVDVQSTPYKDAHRLPRPGHADYPNIVWSRGHNDANGGGHASGRLTAPLVAAGTVAQLLLDQHAIRCAAHLVQVGDLAAAPFSVDVDTILAAAPQSKVFTAHGVLAPRFAKAIAAARRSKDSLGGSIEFMADGVPAGLGDPFFDSVESQLAHLLFAIPAVKGVEFGAGFRAGAMKGSEHNDPFTVTRGKLATASNHAGGILGGRTSGMPIAGRVAVKPTSTLPGRRQATVDLATMKPADLVATGRHDPCIAIRAVPVVQACLRIALADMVLQARMDGLLDAPREKRAARSRATA